MLPGCAREGIYHTVGRGETIYRIGKTYGVDPHYLARTNGIFFPRNLQAGQKLFIPGAKHSRKVIPYGQAKTAKKEIIHSRTASQKTPVSKKSPGKPKALSAKASSTSRARKNNATTAAVPKFSWPVKGRILKSFKSGGEIPSRGLEIAASLGTAVKSAGAGRVIYSGNSIRGYGNLLILEHENSFFTVYGFNQKNLVQTGSFVGDGETIALVGRPPDGRSPRLHFEIRKGNEARNPRIFLP
jgi:lipoprotein NlpD